MNIVGTHKTGACISSIDLMTTLKLITNKKHRFKENIDLLLKTKQLMKYQKNNI